MSNLTEVKNKIFEAQELIRLGNYRLSTVHAISQANGNLTEAMEQIETAIKQEGEN